MNIKLLVLSLICLPVILYVGCSSDVGAKRDGDDQVLIRDRTGREWDVTHARDVYYMNPDYFNYGLGVGAIPSVDRPAILEEGDPGYPQSNSSLRVFGVDHNGEQRAYSVSDLARHEVFNDTYPGDSDNYVSVTY